VIAEAIDTAWTLGRALLAWIAVAATVVTIVLLAAAVTGVWAWQTARHACRAAWRRLTASRRAEQVPRVVQIPARPVQRRSQRPAPSWAHTEPHNREEAA
jgi:hypothetical protein